MGGNMPARLWARDRWAGVVSGCVGEPKGVWPVPSGEEGMSNAPYARKRDAVPAVSDSC